MHPIEIGEHGFELLPARILDDHIEEFGHGRRRRLNFWRR